MPRFTDDTEMAGMTDAEFDTMLVHLSEQLTAAAIDQGYPEDEAPKAASDNLTNEWREDLTPRQWLGMAGLRMNVSTRDCVGV